MENLHQGHRQRLRTRFMENGLDAFDDHTALELLLCYAIPRADVNELAHRLINTFGGLREVLEASPDELRKVKGIGENAAALLAIVPAIMRKSAISSGLKGGSVVLDASEKAGEFLLPYFMGERDEVVYLLTLNNKCRLIRARKFATGDLNSARISIRHLVELAIKDNATSVILSHNHTSGVALPSRSDLMATEEIVKALAAVDIRVLDHIIVADDDYVSLARSNTPCLKEY